MNLALWRAPITHSLFYILVQMDTVTWPTWILATVPWGFQRHRVYLSGAYTGDSMAVLNVPGPLEQPEQAAGCIPYPEGCRLQAAHSAPRPPTMGKEALLTYLAANLPA